MAWWRHAVRVIEIQRLLNEDTFDLIITLILQEALLAPIAPLLCRGWRRKQKGWAAKLQQCLFSWKAVAELRKKSGNCTWLCLPCWHHAGQRIDLIYPSRCWVQRAVIGFGDLWSTARLVSCPLLVLERMEKLFCVRLLLPVPGCVGSMLLQWRRGLWHGGWSLYPNLEYLFLWKGGCSCNLYKLTLCQKKRWGWFGLITELFHHSCCDSVTGSPVHSISDHL